jgi:parallel beta-helix repeat protein
MFSLLLLATPGLANIYYVSGSGADSNAGLTAATAFRTLQKAASLTAPGDTVLVMNGTYSTSPYAWNNAVLTVTNSGTATQPITFSAGAGQHPVITTAGNTAVWDAVDIEASYIVLSGFEIVGNAQHVTLAQATATALTEEAAYVASVAAHTLNSANPIVYPGDPVTNGNCVFAQNVVGITVTNNLIHDCSAGGIAMQSTDYVTISGNVVFNTSWWTMYGSSGISLGRALNSDSATTYKNFVVNNISHDNGNTQPYYNFAFGAGVPTDGNGIIIDSNELTNDGKRYFGRTLVMGNIAYNNGGTGAHTYHSQYVDMLNNTAFMNNHCPILGSSCGSINNGQILANASVDINIYNNIMFAPKGKWMYESWQNTNVSEDYNLFYSANGQTLIKDYVLNQHDKISNANFSATSKIALSSATPAGDARAIANPTEALTALSLLTSSPARNVGSVQLDNGTAIRPVAMNGNQDLAIDLGALSFAAPGKSRPKSTYSGVMQISGWPPQFAATALHPPLASAYVR